MVFFLLYYIFTILLYLLLPYFYRSGPRTLRPRNTPLILLALIPARVVNYYLQGLSLLFFLLIYTLN